MLVQRAGFQVSFFPQTFEFYSIIANSFSETHEKLGRKLVYLIQSTQYRLSIETLLNEIAWRNSEENDLR